MVDLSLASMIVLLVRILISSIILYLSVKLVGGKVNFKNSVLLVAVMEALNSFILPLFTAGIISLAIYVIVWLLLAMNFFKISFWKAILVAIVQGIVAFLLAFLSLLTVLGSLVGIANLAK